MFCNEMWEKEVLLVVREGIYFLGRKIKYFRFLCVKCKVIVLVLIKEFFKIFLFCI